MMTALTHELEANVTKSAGGSGPCDTVGVIRLNTTGADNMAT